MLKNGFECFLGPKCRGLQEGDEADRQNPALVASKPLQEAVPAARPVLGLRHQPDQPEALPPPPRLEERGL